MASRRTMKSAFESLMFVWGEPLDVKMAAEIFNITKQEAYDCFIQLQQEYEQEGRGIVIREVNKAFQFATREENFQYIERLCTPIREKKLSQSALEVLSIIAYKQPVTKGEIEAIRGIKCDRIIEGLVKKNLVQEVGRSAGIGRPILFGTTDAFLKHFGFRDIKDLPKIDDIESVLNVELEEEEGEWQQIAIELSELEKEGEPEPKIVED